MVIRVHCASIPWLSKDSDASSVAPYPNVWYFQAGRSKTTDMTKFFASDNLQSFSSTKCDEPKNLPQQFMDWFRESTSDPSVLSLAATEATSNFKSSPSLSLDTLIAESDLCSATPSTNPDSSMMERALCPWEWRLNRDETREPKLISEAKCLCRRSRSPVTNADCLPIQREFPVLRRIYCDDNGNYQYVKSYETITVGCHSVMPRMAKAQVAPWLLRPKEV